MSDLCSDPDDEKINDVQTNEVIKSLKRSLFKRSKSSTARAQAGTEDNVIVKQLPASRIQLAVTVNPDPYTLMNKRMYRLYSHDKQRAMLTRIENAARRDLGDVNLVKLVFEICPKLQQVHLHAWYDLPDLMVTPLELYFTKRVSRKTGPSWRAFLSKEIYDEKGWLDYMTKESPSK